MTRRFVMLNVIGSMKSVSIALALLAVPLYAEPTCKSVGLIEGCFGITAAPHPSVKLFVKTYEENNDYLPIAGFWVEGRIAVVDNGIPAFVPFLQFVPRGRGTTQQLPRSPAARCPSP
jgi:hypothetical protein